MPPFTITRPFVPSSFAPFFSWRTYSDAPAPARTSDGSAASSGPTVNVCPTGFVPSQ